MIEKFSLNENVFYWVNSFAGKSDFWNGVFVFWAEYLIYIMIVFFAAYFARLVWKDRKVELREIFLYFSIPFIAWFFAKIIKFFMPTERPFSVLENVTQLTEESVMSSFPSGHSTMAFALATAIYMYNKKIGIIFFILAFFVAISRSLVGVHFPLDIFVGMLIGVLVPVAFDRAWRKFKK